MDLSKALSSLVICGTALSALSALADVREPRECAGGDCYIAGVDPVLRKPGPILSLSSSPWSRSWTTRTTEDAVEPCWGLKFLDFSC
jgi:hypothetical protein